LEALLAPCFVQNDGGGVRQVQAAIAGLQWQAQNPFRGQALQDLFRQAARFRAEQESVAGLEAGVEE